MVKYVEQNYSGISRACHSARGRRCSLTGSCSHASSNDRSDVDPGENSPDYDKPVVVGTIESKEITESSGLCFLALPTRNTLDA
jgi:hypothetical protein